MHISVRMTSISFWMDCRHAQFSTNDYHFFLTGLSSYTFLYEWLPSVFEWIFVMHISLRMTTFSFWIDCLRANFFTNEYSFLFEWLVVIHISVRMTTISFLMDCRHTHFCTNDYHFFFTQLSSCTFLYGWLPSLFELIFVMHISVQMTTISLYMDCRHAYSVQMTFHILCIWIFVMDISVRMTFHILLVFHVFNALQGVNSMVQWRIINDIIIYIGSDHVRNALQWVNSMEQWRVISDIIIYIGFRPCA